MSRRISGKAEKIRKIKDEIAEEIFAEAGITLEKAIIPGTEEENKGVSRKNSNRTKITSDEFLSGLSKEDKLVPVITVVVQFDADQWDGAL